jgi:uncharacterized protein YceK
VKHTNEPSAPRRILNGSRRIERHRRAWVGAASLALMLLLVLPGVGSVQAQTVALNGIYVLQSNGQLTPTSLTQGGRTGGSGINMTGTAWTNTTKSHDLLYVWTVSFNTTSGYMISFNEGHPGSFNVSVFLALFASSGGSGSGPAVATYTAGLMSSWNPTTNMSTPTTEFDAVYLHYQASLSSVLHSLGTSFTTISKQYSGSSNASVRLWGSSEAQMASAFVNMSGMLPGTIATLQISSAVAVGHDAMKPTTPGCGGSDAQYWDSCPGCQTWYYSDGEVRCWIPPVYSLPSCGQIAFQLVGELIDEYVEVALCASGELISCGVAAAEAIALAALYSDWAQQNCQGPPLCTYPGQSACTM